ncbi:unnamed protein product, partial [Strongylus vulgaris]
MTFLERTVNFATILILRIVVKQIMRKYEDMLGWHGIYSRIEDYKARTNYILSNSDEFLEFAVPTSQRIVHVGGIALPEKTELTKELRDLMERGDRAGVVYISFGTIVPTKDMPSHFREAIFHVAKTFPQITFLWKMDADDEAPLIPNLHSFTWVP